MGRWLITLGFILIVTGSIIQFAPWLVSWFGRLPGDIRIENEHSKVFVPITSMLVLSVVLSLVFSILVNLFRR